MLIMINSVAITKTLPIIIGKSKVFKAFTISFPNPFQLKIYSTKTAPANMDANHPEIAVTTGTSTDWTTDHFVVGGGSTDHCPQP